MKLIHFDGFIQFIKDNPKLFLDDYAQAVFGELAYEKLKTIDPIATIDEMIEENNQIKCALTERWNESLQELKSRLLNNN